MKLLAASTMPPGWIAVVRENSLVFAITAQGLGDNREGNGAIVLGENGIPIETWQWRKGETYIDNPHPSKFSLALKSQLK